MKRALFIGRFQPFHIAHLKDIKDLSCSHDEVLIGIGSSQEKRTKENPFSLKERKDMVNCALRQEKIENYRIYPVPDLYNDRKWASYIFENLPNFDCAHSGNIWTLKCLKRFGSKVRKIKLIKGISSTRIRSLMSAKKEWKHLVPESVYEYINNINKKFAHGEFFNKRP
jgi:nicotinamide-nucleotide adenylyltransferase